MNEKILKSKSINQIKKFISQLEHHKSHQVPYEQYFQLMVDALSEVTLYTLNDMVDFSAEGFGIFRAREVSNDRPFELVEDMWAKRPDLVKDFGRCNNKNESMFYCSNFFLTCLVECRAKENSKWVLAEYEPSTAEKIITMPIGINEHIFKFKPESELNTEQFKKNEIIRKFIRDSFKAVVSSRDTSRYLRTIAITDFLFKSEQISGKDACIMYPSVADFNKNVNYVFHPETARRKLKIKRAFYVEVVKQENSKKSLHAELKFLANGKVDGDRIVWTKNEEVHFAACLKESKVLISK